MTAALATSPAAVSPPESPPEVTTDSGGDALSDEQLAARVQGGCVKSYEQLDQRYRVRLIHLLRRRVGREADAEDLAQVALWTAYEKIGRYDPNRKFSTWLFTIAVRKAIDHGRFPANRPASAGGISGGGGDATLGLADERNPGPLQRAIAAEENDRAGALWRLADEVLKPKQWTALWLHYGEDQTPAEIAKAMHITRVNARVLLHRARKALSDALTVQGNLE